MPSGADAVHVASALDLKWEEFVTSDGRIKKMAAKPALAKRGIKVIVASATACLPDKYLQERLPV